MKKFLKIASLAFVLLATIACENDDQSIASAKGGPELLTPVDGAEYILLPENATNEVTTLVWNHADYNLQTEVNYDVQFALADTEFATVVSGGTITDRLMVLTVQQLNQVALDLGAQPFTATDIDVRIKSSLGSNSELEAYSNVITIKVTAYTTDLPKLYVVGGFLNAGGYGSDWTASNGVPLSASGFGKTDFEGYVYFNAASFEYKFLPTTVDFAGDWGDDGSFTNKLVQENESNCIGTGAGYYFVKANTGVVSGTNPDGLKYSIQPTSWAITGAATPLGWPDNGVVDQDMTYNSATKKWEIIIALTSGGDNKFKFRANDDWAINYGDPGNDGSLELNSGDNLFVPANGTYKVILDLSNPRDYKWSATLQ
jgi:hypothetical protein